jgi:uncharacterized protein (TIGR03086 family)
VTQLPEDFRRAVEQFGQKVHAIPEDAWARPTPCSEWDVRALLNHVVYETSWAQPLIEGRTIAEVGDRFDGDLLGDDPRAAWDAAAAAAVEAMSSEGAMERTVHISSGDVAAARYAAELFIDLVIHGWDLARGIGHDDTIDPTFAAQLYAEAAPRERELRTYGVYGEHVDVPDDADTQTKLLAVFGRRQ